MSAGAPSPFPEVDKWINDMTPATQVSASRFGSVESVSFFAPPGFGPSAEVIVLVDGIPSPYASYTYDAPTISNLAPDRKSLPVAFSARCAAKNCFSSHYAGTNLTTRGTLHVWIDGASLCNPARFSNCGSVLFEWRRTATGMPHFG